MEPYLQDHCKTDNIIEETSSDCPCSLLLHPQHLISAFHLHWYWLFVSLTFYHSHIQTAFTHSDKQHFHWYEKTTISQIQTEKKCLIHTTSNIFTYKTTNILSDKIRQHTVQLRQSFKFQVQGLPFDHHQPTTNFWKGCRPMRRHVGFSKA